MKTFVSTCLFFSFMISIADCHFVFAEEIDFPKSAELIIEKTNRFRKEHDLSPVQSNEKLTKTAQEFADFMADTSKYGHNADGRAPAERVTANDYEYCLVSENIAYRQDPQDLTAQQLAEFFTQGWIDSPGHRKNMLAEHVVETGVAVASKDNTTFYAVQLFGSPKSAAFKVQITNATEVTQTLHILDDDQKQQKELPPRTILTLTRCLPVTLSLQDEPSQASSHVKISQSKSYEIVADENGEKRIVEAKE